MKITSLAHVCLKTRDLARTEDFYCGILGMEKVFNFTLREEVIGFYLKATNETFIEVFRDGEAFSDATKRTLAHFCLQTDSVEGLRQRLVDRGYAPREIIMGADHSPQFWVQDPNGLDIEFQQYTDESSQITGGEVELT